MIEKIPVMAKGMTIKRYIGRPVSFTTFSPPFASTGIAGLSKNAVLIIGKK
jgi:hypothetical protein